MDKLCFGTAGIPSCTEKGTTEQGIAKVKELGLDSLEMEFVQGVYLSEDKARMIYAIRKKEDIVLTAHGPYFINLNAIEKEKMHASIQRILKTARISYLAGAYSITFHAGFYLKMEKETVYKTIKQRMQEIMKTLKDEGNTIWVRPELTGKETQFGDIDELLKLSLDVEGVMPCIDFSHQHARYNGKYNTFPEFSEILGKVEKALGKEGLHNMHIHVSGIEYGPKGEKNHLLLEQSDFKYKELLRAFKEYSIKGVVVCESPNIEGDALLLKKAYQDAKP
jgi:deoxyribonuclease IV